MFILFLVSGKGMQCPVMIHLINPCGFYFFFFCQNNTLTQHSQINMLDTVLVLDLFLYEFQFSYFHMIEDMTFTITF